MISENLTINHILPKLDSLAYILVADILTQLAHTSTETPVIMQNNDHTTLKVTEGPMCNSSSYFLGSYLAPLPI